MAYMNEEEELRIRARIRNILNKQIEIRKPGRIETTLAPVNGRGGKYAYAIPGLIPAPYERRIPVRPIRKRKPMIYEEQRIGGANVGGVYVGGANVGGANVGGKKQYSESMRQRKKGAKKNPWLDFVKKHRKEGYSFAELSEMYNA